MPRQLIEPHKGDKRYVRRKKGKFTTKQVKVGRSLAAGDRSPRPWSRRARAIAATGGARLKADAGWCRLDEAPRAAAGKFRNW
jgi:hypothetical protein